VSPAACESTVIAVVRGHVRASGPAVVPGDLALADGDTAVVAASNGGDAGASVFMIASDGPATVVVAGVHDTCGAPAAPQVARASDAPELTWAGGKMHAHLDVARSAFYVGRLAGGAAVAQHKHDGSWEVLAAVDASGTFVLAGKEQHLGPKQIVFVPPGTLHEWKPDPGSSLVALQIYDPPGPEQRFKKLAADAADAGR
jgi:mannose-6-phosphate isomerase-like protein (cupin superfamily)